MIFNKNLTEKQLDIYDQLSFIMKKIKNKHCQKSHLKTFSLLLLLE